MTYHRRLRRSPNWEPFRESIRAGKIEVETAYPDEGGPVPDGLLFLGAYLPDLPLAAAVVQYRVDDDERQLDILYAWVYPELRCCGLMTEILARLRDTFPAATIVTDEGSDSGVRWLKKMGFDWNGVGWELAPEERA